MMPFACAARLAGPFSPSGDYASCGCFRLLKTVDKPNGESRGRRMKLE
jgi:hypothetical protein